MPIAKGLKQGCPCSPLLFSLLFDRVEEAVVRAAAGTIPASRHFFRFSALQLLLLLFADDVALVARTRESLECLFRAFRDFCDAHRLTINTEKTQVLMIRGDQQQ